MGISTHILDTTLGRPAAAVPVWLTRAGEPLNRTVTGQDETDQDGRCRLLHEPPVPGVYTLHFDTASYYAAQGISGLYPRVDITFTVAPDETHYHIPLLLTPNGYSTYRGS